MVMTVSPFKDTEDIFSSSVLFVYIWCTDWDPVSLACSPREGQWSLTRVRGLYGQLVQIPMLTNLHWRATASV